MSGLVIIGASYAGVQSAATAREVGYSGPITLIGDESDFPYQRPPLSKGLLLGKATEVQLMLRGERFFASQNIELVLAREVISIDRQARRIQLSDGAIHAYDVLVLATGSRARPFQVPGADLQGVHHLRSLGDARALQAQLQTASSVVVIGGGFIGLEVASAAVTLGKAVTVLESAPRLLQRGVSRVAGDYVLDLHRSKGVHIVLDAQVGCLQGHAGRVASARYNENRTINCDLAVVGIGGLPNDGLAQACGLVCDGGIVVDEFGRTSDPKIFAAGDCTNHPNRFAGRRLRLESVQNALDQGRATGATVAGKAVAYTAVPRFWSDQYDSKLQMVGLSLDHASHAVRGSTADGRFSVFLYRGEQLVGIDSVNSPADHVAGRKLLAAGASVRPDEAADPAFDLRAAAAEAG